MKGGIDWSSAPDLRGAGPPEQLLINFGVTPRKGGLALCPVGLGLADLSLSEQAGERGEHPGQRGLGLASSCHRAVGAAALLLLKSGDRWGCRLPRDGPGVRMGRGRGA